MPSNVERLKELLFDSESERLAALAERVDQLTHSQRQARDELLTQLTQVSSSGSLARAEILARLEEIDRDGRDAAKLEHRVSEVIDGALRRAESERHDVVSDAMAPFVVDTVRAEIRNSQDMMVEALYPVTGRIVKAYVASAIKDLTEEINRRLETNPLMLRVRSIATGRPVAELAIADSQKLEIEELLLIRRGSGELIGRWPDRSYGSNRDQVLSGVLTAINEFSNEALSAGEGQLRHIDLGDARVYLRASPEHLLAARCRGSAPVAVEAVVDEKFLAVIEHLGGLDEPEESETRPILQRLSDDLGKRIREVQEEVSGRRMGVSPLKALVWLIGLPLLAWIAWTFYADWRTSSTRSAAAEVLAASPEIKGYPTRITTGWLGRSVTITGLAPTSDARDTVIARLKSGVPGVTIYDELSVVPNALSDVEPQIEKLQRDTAALTPEFGRVRSELVEIEGRIARAGLKDAIERSQRRLAIVGAELDALGELEPGDARANAAQVRAAVEEAVQHLASAEKAVAAGNAAGDRQFEAAALAAAERTKVATDLLAKLLVAPPPSRSHDRAPGPGIDPRSLVDLVEGDTERLMMGTAALAQVTALKRSLPPPTAPVAVKDSPTPRQRLEAWSRANAFFFSSDASFRDPAAANRQLDELAALVKASGLLVRVVGYTDQLGGQEKNSPLSRLRAETVASGLRDRGIPDRLIAIIGRQNAADISTVDGPLSPNRRVEIEVGFDGEGAP